uniref:Uncharacterized protein n=1 Tax=Pyxicephalus adspersus TaxID=30357 RepID=A0AAV2ZS44_PYXAD|nr:TPA: hypothetical protein GDO54_016608 [Pyxicephalus adspersus]
MPFGGHDTQEAGTILTLQPCRGDPYTHNSCHLAYPILQNSFDLPTPPTCQKNMMDICSSREDPARSSAKLHLFRETFGPSA